MILEMLGESPDGEGTGGTKATSSSTDILQDQLHHPRGGMFTCLLKRQVFDLE